MTHEGINIVEVGLCGALYATREEETWDDCGFFDKSCPKFFLIYYSFSIFVETHLAPF